MIYDVGQNSGHCQNISIGSGGNLVRIVDPLGDSQCRYNAHLMKIPITSISPPVVGELQPVGGVAPNGRTENLVQRGGHSLILVSYYTTMWRQLTRPERCGRFVFSEQTRAGRTAIGLGDSKGETSSLPRGAGMATPFPSPGSFLRLSIVIYDVHVFRCDPCFPGEMIRASRDRF